MLDSKVVADCGDKEGHHSPEIQQLVVNYCDNNILSKLR